MTLKLVGWYLFFYLFLGTCLCEWGREPSFSYILNFNQMIDVYFSLIVVALAAMMSRCCLFFDMY